MNFKFYFEFETHEFKFVYFKYEFKVCKIKFENFEILQISNFTNSEFGFRKFQT